MAESGAFIICLLFITCFYTGSDAQVPVDCCLHVTNTQVDKKVIVDYKPQIHGQGCAIDAMLLVTRHQRTLCVPLTEPWVGQIISHVDKLKTFCKKHNYKPRSCHAVKKV